MTGQTQTEGVLALLRSRGEEGVTALDALREVGTMRLSHHIFVLREQGHAIETKYEKHRSGTHGRYILSEEPTLWGRR